MHYLRANDSCWSPPHVFFWDTETRTIANTEPQVEELRLWCARRIDRKGQVKSQPQVADSYGETGMELAQWITAQSQGRPSLWGFAHNLSFDLVSTRLPMALASLGWSITDAAVGGRAPWLRFARGRSGLALVDSGSWLNRPLQEIGDQLGLTKPPLPAQMDTARAWRHRCRADVDILATAMQQLMDWWDHERLGRWDLTGAGTGWHAFRHLPQVQRTVVDPDSARVEADRAAIYGGRRGTWRHGRITDGPLIELDFAGAYPTIAAGLPLPVRPGADFRGLSVDDWRVMSDRWGMIAEVTINTEVPGWPLRWGGQTWYPTGRFTTVLASPDIWAAREAGALESIGPGTMHQLGFAMQNWAKWVLELQNPANAEVPAMARIAAKNWGRAVIGKWAARGFEKIELGQSPVAGWGYSEGWDHERGVRGGLVDIAGQRWWVSASGESDNAYPAIPAFVEAYVRTRLGEVIAGLGRHCVVQCDTDGVIVRSEVVGCPNSGGSLIAPAALGPADRLSWVLGRLNQATAPLVLRTKRSTRQITVTGPQHVSGGSLTRHAGISRTSKQVSPNTYVGRTWPGLQWQMSQGDPRGYARPEVTSVIRGVHATGWVTASGSVIAPRATIAASGETTLTPWGLMPAEIQKMGLAPEQNRRLPT